MRVGAKTLGVVVVLLLLLAAYLFIPVLHDPSANFLSRKGQLQHVAITRQWNTVTSALSDITLTSSSGLQVQITLNRPNDLTKQHPLVILMGGYLTGRHAAELIHDSHGIVIAAISYPYHGPTEMDKFGFFRNVGLIREAVLDTPPAVLLALDYLAKLKYVDPAHIELAGVSFGAFLASIPGALDPRFKRVWLIHGAGDPAAVFDHLTEEKIRWGPLRWLMTRSFAVLIQAPYLKPERWVGRISPRPVIVVHARPDPSFPPESIEALDQALRQPFQIIWLGKEHIGVRSPNLIQQIADLIFQHVEKDKLN